MYEGFLPIATSRFLVPKLHKERCVIYPLNRYNSNPNPRQQQQQEQEQQNGSRTTQNSSNNNQNRTQNQNQNQCCGVHISKSTKKKAKRFTFTVNQEFEKVVQGCHHQHGISWLYPPIVRAFRQLHQATILSNNNDGDGNDCSSSNGNTTGNGNGNGTDRDRDKPVSATAAIDKATGKGAGTRKSAKKIVEEDDVSSNDSDDSSYDTDTFPVKLYSVEVYNAQTGKLAGGELGYAVGTLYTSLTGFSCEDSAGSVQLGALGKLLWSLGFDMWDMGMSLAYKTKLGAEEMNRGVFVDTVKALRKKKLNETGMECILKCDAPRSCKELIGLSERIS